MDKLNLSDIISDYHALGRKLQKYIDQLPETADEKISTLEDAMTQIDEAIDDMEAADD